MKRDRILLSDSAVLTNLLHKAVFRRRNCRFFLASTGEEVWELTEKEDPDIIFLDLDLPGIDEALCRRIKGDSRFQAVPIIAVASGKRDLKEFRQAGCDDILIGPLRRHRLPWLIRRMLGFPLRQQQRFETSLSIRYGAGPAVAHTARTLNLATGGVLILAPQPLPIHTPILVELFLSGSDPPIRCRGRIAWLGAPVEEEPWCREPGFREMGIEFIGLSPEDKDLIRRIVESESLRIPA